jgi:hypothetical protein
MMVTRKATSVLVLMALSAGSVLAQGTQTSPAKAGKPVKIDVVIERYTSDNKKVSSMPFVVWMGATEAGNARGSIRVGVDVPVGSNTETRTNGNGTPSTTSSTINQIQYRNVGTSIDCYLSGRSDGYVLQLNLNDTSIFDPEAQRKASLAAKGLIAPQAQGAVDGSAFRTFSVNNELPIRDGQTVEYAVATDKVTGEIVKVLVTMTISK